MPEARPLPAGENTLVTPSCRLGTPLAPRVVRGRPVTLVGARRLLYRLVPAALRPSLW